MKLSKHYRHIFLIIGLALGLILSGCASHPEESTLPAGTYPVDPFFREFYNLLGGENTLGYAISPMFAYQNLKMQYVENGLMHYDPDVPATRQFSLAPLGTELGVNDPPILLPEQEGARIVDGYVIYPEFVSLYDSLQGARFVGRPLTQVRINTERGRIEQYFANLGFYRLLSDKPGVVHLLAYGAWKCDLACRSSAPATAIVSREAFFPEPLMESLSRWGTDFTGRPLSKPYRASDGMLEQVYENFVVYADPADIRLVQLRPIPPEVGFPATPPVAKMADPRMIFYPTSGDLGHNVPTVFDNYIALHGGMEISGPPISEISPEGSVYRQCFTNYCLDYDPNAATALRIRPAPLGSLYLKQHPLPNASESVNLSPENAQVKVWEAQALISSTHEQQIFMEVIEAASQKAIPDVEATLTVLLPEGAQVDYHFPPTDESGRSTVTLTPISAPNGTLVPYKVCLNTSGGTPNCVEDSFVIWGTP